MVPNLVLTHFPVGRAVSVMEWLRLVVHSLANRHRIRPLPQNLVKLELDKLLEHKRETLEEVSLLVLQVSSAELGLVRVTLLDRHPTILMPTLILI